MGKLLHRLIHGLWPSWLTRINVSDASATKRLLMPFFRAGNLFSNKSSAAASPSSSSSPRSTTTTNSTFYSESEGGNEAPMKANNEILASSTPSSQPATADIIIKTDHQGRKSDQGGKAAAQGRGRRRWVKRKKREKEVISCELPKSLCEMVGASSAVVKYSHEPHHELWESMVDMIVSNGLWEATNLEFLLYCYLSLNEPHLHHIIQMTFLQVLQDLSSTTTS